MVKVEVLNSVTKHSKAIDTASAADLLQHVLQSRHFGPGTLEDAAENLIGNAYHLEEGKSCAFTWYPGE